MPGCNFETGLVPVLVLQNSINWLRIIT